MRPVLLIVTIVACLPFLSIALPAAFGTARHHCPSQHNCSFDFDYSWSGDAAPLIRRSVPLIVKECPGLLDATDLRGVAATFDDFRPDGVPYKGSETPWRFRYGLSFRFTRDGTDPVLHRAGESFFVLFRFNPPELIVKGHRGLRICSVTGTNTARPAPSLRDP